MTDFTPDLSEENARLRVRIATLEAELDLRARLQSQAANEAADTAHGIPDRMMDQAIRYSRGVAAATLESVRVSTESFDRFSAELTRRDITSDPVPLGSLLLDLPNKVFAGVVKAVDHSIDGQSRVLNRFFDSYNAPLRQPVTGL